MVEEAIVLDDVLEALRGGLREWELR